MLNYESWKQRFCIKVPTKFEDDQLVVKWFRDVQNVVKFFCKGIASINNQDNYDPMTQLKYCLNY